MREVRLDKLGPREIDRVLRDQEREIRRAMKRAAKIVGKAYADERQGDLQLALETVTKRRLKAVRSFVTRGGSLILTDLFPGASIQDTGGVIRSTRPGGWLAVGKRGWLAKAGAAAADRLTASRGFLRDSAGSVVARLKKAITVRKIGVRFVENITAVRDRLLDEIDREMGGR